MFMISFNNEGSYLIRVTGRICWICFCDRAWPEANMMTSPALISVEASLTKIFFSSRLADVALRLGPYMSISSQKDICTRTQ